MIEITCYGMVHTFDDLVEARTFFTKAVLSTEGAERDRYINILMQIEDGLEDYSDEF